MSKRRSYTLLVLAVFALGTLLRAVPLYWSGLPATLDGFRYARLARLTVATGHLPIETIDPDEIGFTLVLAGGSALTGIQPVRLAQPLAVVLGAATPLVGVLLARIAGTDLGWSPRRTYYAAAVAGVGLTLDGLFLRRTGVPDEELLGLFLVPVLAVVFLRTLQSWRLRWLGATATLCGILPLVHNLSTLMGVLTMTALLAVRLPRMAADEALFGSSLVAAAWIWLAGYFAIAARLGIHITHSEHAGILSSHLGLFVGWVVLLAFGVAWMRSLSPRGRAAVAAVPLGIWFFVVSVNVVRPVYPGTIQTPLVVLALLMTFIIPAIFGVAGLAVVEGASQDLLLALLVAPITLTLYALTASLSPDFFNLILRVQTFAHVPAIVLATIAVIRSDHLTAPRITSHQAHRSLRAVIALVLLAALATSTPLAYMNLDTATYPSTTLESEFEAATFAAAYIDGPVATDQTTSSLLANYYETEAEPTMEPTAVWLRNGPSPTCPMLMQASWTTSGAHLFPSAPETSSTAQYEALLMKHDVVYHVSGRDPVIMTIPHTATGAGCR